MAMAKVWNDNVIDHVESFKGKKYIIPSKGFIEMDAEEAILFRGQFFAPKFDKGGIQTVESKKRIRVETKEDVREKAPQHVCMKCGHEAPSAASLNRHIKANHVDAMIDDEARETMLKE